MIKPTLNILMGLFFGAVAGLGASFLCRVFAGGVCPLTSDPATSSLLGALIGALVVVTMSMKDEGKSGEDRKKGD